MLLTVVRVYQQGRKLSEAELRAAVGMEVLVAYLASVRGGWEDEDAPIH